VTDLRDAATAAGGHAVVLTAPPAVRDRVDLWGPVPGLELMRRIKEQFDPTGRLAPGRFLGGI
jgi:glycolate oxidase FAD binding subunit